ncbi:TonB-dependent receptor [Rariglobus hedericola]|uniref:TonB-dependent receptor n=1 Tax=Rariglobus hedericola TaxID=2597822 RepID=A0A556QP95_9BACT|nr:TonB-dependent receptor [Rariglobus hedericola]TSJ78468.1 TonB-dependent receptor [Rariglobus hedericola]
MQRLRIASLLLASSLVLRAQDSAPVTDAVELSPVTVYSPDVANQDPVASYATPITALRFEPLVDVQARGFAEGQSDISIRGGTFENTGFSIGALPIYDPQTGHYFGELPVAPAMLSAPSINTGADNSINGWNATAGSVAYGWSRIRDTGFVSAAGGSDNLLRTEAYAGYTSDKKLAGRVLAADASVAYSESNGSRDFGDHELTRYNARIQLADDVSQTDLFAGYQDKFIGWRELYAGPFNSRETDDLQTTLIALNHRITYGADGDYFQAGAYYRRNDDEYQFNRAAPNANFIHQTDVTGGGFEGRASITEATAIRYRAGIVADKIDSTALFVAPTRGRYDDRTQGYAGAFADHTISLDADRSLVLTGGANYDASNRSGSAVSPVAEIALLQDKGALKRLYVSYAEATQLPTYTALNSNSAAGFFRGNRNLGRSESKNFELGADTAVSAWTFKTAVFFRKDENLVDWTFNPLVPGAARIAAQGDVDTLGFESVARRSFEHVDLVFGYSWLHKNEDYLAPGTDSFYAFNFPEHRVTAAIVARLGAGFEARMDNEFRVQESNALRRRNDEVVLSSLGLYYSVPRVKGLTLSAQVDNLWNTYFEEVPLVPGPRREFSLGARYAW